MKISTFQFDCKLGDVEGNILHADALLETTDLHEVELLVGPELAMTGYNFPTLEAVSAFLEPTCGGATAWWAIRAARRYGLVISIGYPEFTLQPDVIPDLIMIEPDINFGKIVKNAQEAVEKIRSMPAMQYWTFNSTMTIAPDGRILGHYRKTHLYYTDATWASPSIDGFVTKQIYFPAQDKPLYTAFAICMDLNPQAFTADYTVYEVASHAISTKANLLIISTAWMTLKDAGPRNDVSPCCTENNARTPDMETLTYWIERLLPLVKAKEKTVVVIGNRIGMETGEVKACDLERLVRPAFQNGNSRTAQSSDEMERPAATKSTTADKMVESTAEIKPGVVCNSAHYAGTSTVMTLGEGRVMVHGLSSRGTQDVLVADTEDEAIMEFRLRQIEE